MLAATQKSGARMVIHTSSAFLCALLRAFNKFKQTIVEANAIGNAEAGGVVLAAGSRVIEVIPLDYIIERMLRGLFLRQPVEDASSPYDKLLRPGGQTFVDQGVYAGPDGRGGAGTTAGGPLALIVDRY